MNYGGTSKSKKMEMGGMMTGDKFLPTLRKGADMVDPMEIRMRMGGAIDKAMMDQAMKGMEKKIKSKPKRGQRVATTKAKMKKKKLINKTFGGRTDGSRTAY